MSTIFTIVILILCLAWIASLICIVVPIKALGYSTRKEAFQGLFGATVLIIGIAIFFGPDDDNNVAEAPTGVELTHSSDEMSSPEKSGAGINNVVASETNKTSPKSVVTYPAEQVLFTDTVSHFVEKYQTAETDFQKGSLRPARRDAICEQLSGRQIVGWYGYATDIRTNGDGLGVVEIEIADGIHFSTWNNSLSDIGHQTLIQPSSNIYQKLGLVKEQSLVKFSAKLFRSEVDCVQEKSFTLSGSLQDPDFLIDLKDIEMVAGAPPREETSFFKSLLD